MHKSAAPKPKSFAAPQPSAQMPWAGQRGTLEDLGSFGISPEDFFGGGGRLMFSDTAPKPALPPKQGSLTEDAYLRGYLKRASEYGFNEDEAFAILKEAQVNLKPIVNMAAPVKDITHNMAKAAPVQKLTDTINRVTPIRKLATIELLKSAQPGLGVIATGLGNAAAPQTSAPAPKPGFMDKARSWLGSKLPGYPTSTGNTRGGVDALANQFNELAGG